MQFVAPIVSGLFKADCQKWLQIRFRSDVVSHSVELILKLVGILWNNISWSIDMLSSTSVDFIRSERELENMHLYGDLPTNGLRILASSLATP